MKKKINNDAEQPVRLQKFIAMCEIASRRHAEKMILAKRVSVNGALVTKLGTKIFPQHDRVEVDGKVIISERKKIYLMLNKPCGCLSTLSDDRKRPTVVDLLQFKTRVFPVGRLDYNSEGLLLLTNDGEFAHMLTHPKHKIPKIYFVKVKGIPDERTMERMKKGVFIDGIRIAFSDVKIHRETGKNTWITVTLHEGKNRQIRKVCEGSGHLVIKLRRVEYGGVSIGKLLPREYRPLTFNEIRRLKKAAGIGGKRVRVNT